MKKLLPLLFALLLLSPLNAAVFGPQLPTDAQTIEAAQKASEVSVQILMTKEFKIVLATTKKKKKHWYSKQKYVEKEVTFTFEGGCSGTYVSENEILTAGHCVLEDWDSIQVKDPNDKKMHDATVVKLDQAHDLAMLYVYGMEHKYAEIGHTPMVGQSVINVGCPFMMPFIVSHGIVSKLDYTIDESPWTSKYTVSDATINGGSSGGGQFDLDGNLIGVTTAHMSNGDDWAGITFAVSTNDIQNFLNLED
jgi:S1-C subfamily serine protease